MALTERGRAVVSGAVVPRTESDHSFKMATALELVFAWQDSSSADVRAALERVMFNVGVEVVPAEGDFAEHFVLVTGGGRRFLSKTGR